MEGQSRKEEGCHQFLDFLPKQKEMEMEMEMGWILRQPQETDETKLELCLGLGPPGGEQGDHFPDNVCVQNTPLQQFLHLQPVMKKPSQPAFSNGVIAEKEGLQISVKKAFSAAPVKTAVPQKRTASAQAVGWPPIRYSRKNLAGGGGSKLPSQSTKVEAPENVSRDKPVQDCPNTLFVKVNMDGIPIGRKVDLKAFDSYEKLSYAVDELFKVLAAQSDGSADGIDGGGNSIPLVNGNGEYMLVYEDNEGDRMLVGDVPWHMFVSTVKRLRVLRSSELPTLSRESKLVRA